ncbi:MAG: serine/threonine-protein kinase [Gemmatimonadota bacterium]
MNDPLERLLIGRSLVGRYAIEEVIGRGGMSIVYRARDERLGRHVALKILRFPSDVAATERDHLRERLKREAAAAARIPPHPNVVQIYDYGTDEELDLDFIAMELLQGRDLKELLRSSGLGLPEAQRVLIEAARGIAAGHRAGLVHRDVKPANVFLTGDRDLEMVKILDFGIAKALDPGIEEDDLTRDGRIPHSPAYTSPEQLDLTRPVTPASDVYQLGLLAYEMLAGERPYTERQRERIHEGDRVPLEARGRWREVSDRVSAAVARALEPRPEDRFADAAEFARALDGPPGAVAAHGVARIAADDDETLFAPGRPVKAVPRPGIDLRTPALVAAAFAAVAIVVWAMIWGSAPGADEPRSDLAGEAATAGAAQDVESGDAAVNASELDEVFRDLTVDAFEELEESVAAEEGEEAAAAVQGEAPGRARALFNRRWRFEGDDVWDGAARDEMVLVREGESWRVVSEAELESFTADS